MSLYEMTVPCFTQMLRSLQGFLTKGEARAQEVGFDRSKPGCQRAC